MAIELKTIVLTLFFLIMFSEIAQSTHVFDVTKHGMKGTGVPDITRALDDAWKQACAWAKPTIVLIPKGTFNLNEILLMGPCKASMQLQIDGTLVAPQDPKKFKPKGSWLTFKALDHFSLTGHGTLDGQGASSWARCIKSSCALLPVNMKFQKISNGIIRDVTSLNSKHFHACINDCHNITVSHVHIHAPAESPNTDGIHISQSSNVTVVHSNIATGDDCVSMIHSNQQVNISQVTCGPGHGISIGSLGKYKDEGPVDGITVTHCKFNNTDNGLRVKTWPNHRRGWASNILFEDINMTNVTNPIIIDQAYCPTDNCNTKGLSGIKIKNIKFRKIHGTTATPEAVQIMCSKTTPCEGVEIGDIDLKYLGNKGNITSLCSNVKPKCFGKLIPPICIGPNN